MMEGAGLHYLQGVDMNLKVLRLAMLATTVLLAGAAIPATTTPPTAADRPVAHDTYSDDEVAKAASDFFSTGA
jgi:hypothetical protein